MVLKRVGRTLKETLLINDEEGFYLENISEFRGWLEDDNLSTQLLNNDVALSVYANSDTGVVDLFDYPNTRTSLVSNNNGDAIINNPKLGKGLAKSSAGMSVLANDKATFKRLISNNTVANYIENNRDVFTSDIFTADSLSINNGVINARIKSSKDVQNKCSFSVPVSGDVAGAGGGGSGGGAFDNDIDNDNYRRGYGDDGQAGESSTFAGVTAAAGGGGNCCYNGPGSTAGNGAGGNGGSGGYNQGDDGSSSRGGHGEKKSFSTTIPGNSSEQAIVGNGGSGGSRGCDNRGSCGGNGSSGQDGWIDIVIDVNSI